MFLLHFYLDPSNPKDLKAVPKQIPDESKFNLIKIANWLLDNQIDDFLTVYGIIRGGVLQRSLTMLRNHQKSVSGGSVHGASSSPMLVKKTVKTLKRDLNVEF